MSDRLICDDCAEPISAEQWRLLGCCVNCERKLRHSWANMDKEHYGLGVK